jgi:gluconolactonase
MNLDIEPAKVADGFEFCEGPAFALDGQLWLVNLQGGYLSRIHPDGRVARVADSPGPNGGQFDADGNYLLCDSALNQILSVTTDGEISVAVEAGPDGPLNGPNDLAVDADGGFYFTDPDGSSLDKPIGAVYYVRPDRTVVRVDESLSYPNGINITVDRSAVLVAETMTRQIHRYDRNPDGTLGPRELFCQLEGGAGPDGMCFDLNGNLYVAHYGSACVDVINPAGERIGALPLPGDNPTNCTFGLPGSSSSSSLFVTEVVTNAVWRFDLDVAGMPLHHLAVASD